MPHLLVLLSIVHSMRLKLAVVQPCLCVGLQALLLLYVPYLQDSMPSKFFMLQTLMVLLLLQAAMWHLWIDLGAGNANFFFAATLLYAAWQVTRGKIFLHLRR